MSYKDFWEKFPPSGWISDPEDRHTPEGEMSIALELVRVLRSHYGDEPERGAAAVMMALTSLVGPARARSLVGAN